MATTTSVRNNQKSMPKLTDHELIKGIDAAFQDAAKNAVAEALAAGVTVWGRDRKGHVARERVARHPVQPAEPVINRKQHRVFSERQFALDIEQCFRDQAALAVKATIDAGVTVYGRDSAHTAVEFDTRKGLRKST